jgi:enoyl-CoA hydratase
VEFVELDKQDSGMALLTINRPQAMNTLSEAVLRDMQEALEEIARDDSVVLTVITGRGSAFVAGADIAEMHSLDEAGGVAWGRLGQKVFRRIETMCKPSIAAVNGYALGGGCELAMACDIRIASERAKFGQPEVGLGVIPGYFGTHRMPRLIGKQKAVELILTGDVIDAEEALRIGLVNQVVPHEELMNAADHLAARILKNAPMAVRYAKQAIRRGLETPEIDRAIEVEAKLFGMCFETADQKEGMGAFLENRKADFKGR